MINIEELRADIEAGTPGDWAIHWFKCIANHSDVEYAKSNGEDLAVGDVLWSVPRGIGPIGTGHNHWAGDHLEVSDGDTRRIARLPQLEREYLAMREALICLRDSIMERGTVTACTAWDNARKALGETQ